MSCPEEKNVALLCAGALAPGEKERILRHIGSCGACSALQAQFGAADRLLRSRKEVRIPDGLARMCVKRIGASVPSPVQRPGFASVGSYRKLRLAFAAGMALIFLAGLAAGKFILGDSSFGRRHSVTGMLRTPETADETRKVKYYLIGVEALFLDFSNMEDPGLLEKDEWKSQMDLCRKVLKQTGRVKAMAENDMELLRLVNEIEWVLTDILGRMELDLAYSTNDLARDIHDQKLINRIHEYVSYIS